MTGYLKHLLGLILVLSVGTWAQAICPMMLFSQAAKNCGQHGTHPAAASENSNQRPGHECCPRMHAGMQKDHCDRAKVSSCATTMSCCVIKRQPANTSKASTAGTNISVIGRVLPSALQSPGDAATIDLSGTRLPRRGALGLKVDLRI